MVPAFPQPGGNVSLCVTPASPHMSLAVAVPVAVGLVSPVHSTVLSSGQVIVGGVVSTILIVCTQVASLSHESVAVHVRVIVPVLPQAVAKVSSDVIVTLPQLSLPLASPVVVGLVSSPHST